ncbi:MAG: alpha/beta hydrolase family protein [Deltaproteobacteria bacterium]|nr:alpha/beta hydrolase family protein [Deltaproteobacteria bacterium]
MGYGETVDAVVGKLSRVLHLRKTNNDTSHELTPYFGLPVDELLPPPPRLPDVKRVKPRLQLGSMVTETIAWRSLHEPLSDAYKRRHRGPYASNLTAYARWVHERSRRRRSLLLYVHGWLEPGSWVEEATLMPMWYRELGVDVAHVQLPFHGRRSPAGQLFHGEWFWTADLVRSLESVRQAVMDVRSIMGWFRDFGYDEVGITGLSLGGCITMLTACVAPLPDYVVPMIAHLELTDAIEEAPILWRMKEDLARFGIDAPHRREIFTRVALSTAAPILAREKQLWVAAREDGYLKAELVEQQWRRWSEPPILWIPGGHMTFPIAIPDIVRKMRALPQKTGGGSVPC